MTKKSSFVAYSLLFSLSLLIGWQVFASITPSLPPVADGIDHSWNSSNGSSTHYTLVNEKGCDSSNYIYTTSTGAYDSFFIDLSSLTTSTITQVDIIPCAAEYTAAGMPSSLYTFYRVDGFQSAPFYYTLTTTTLSVLATSTWSSLSHSLNASSTLEIGVRHRDGVGGSKVSNLKVRLTY